MAHRRAFGSRTRFLTLVVCLLAALGVVSAQSVKRSPFDGAYSAAQAERGHVVFERVCARCHNSDLQGDELMEVPALAGGHFATQWAGEPLLALYRKIAETMPASAPRSLMPREVAEVVAYLLKANGYQAGVADLAPPQAGRSVRDGVYSRAQAARGRILFTDICTACHQDPFWRPTWKGKTLGDLYTRIKTFMPDDNPGSLTGQNVVDALAYILEGNDMPPGSSDLPDDLATLTQIRVEEPK